MDQIKFGNRIFPLFSSMEELEAYFYPPVDESILKQDAPILTTTPGVFRALYGKVVWNQLNQERNVWQAIAKEPWDKSGWRVLTGRARTTPQGVSEAGTIPDSERSSFAEVKATLKAQVDVFEVSQLMHLAQAYDDAIDAFAIEREQRGILHAEMINVALMTNVTTPAGNNFESVDRVVSSYDEVTNCADVHAGDSDIYGLDRDAAASWADAQVLHNSDVDRELTLSLINTLLKDVWTAGAVPKVFITKHDTFLRWSELLETRRMFFGERTFVATYNGIKSVAPGEEGAFAVATYHGIPVIQSKDVVADTIGRIYVLDTDWIRFKVLQPTKYYESGIDVTGDPFAIDKLSNKGMYETIGELVAYRFNVHGKIRDLK